MPLTDHQAATGDLVATVAPWFRLNLAAIQRRPVACAPLQV
jgi:hypothetical protein